MQITIQKTFLVLVIIFLSSCSSLEKELSNLQNSPDSNSIESAKTELNTEQNTNVYEPTIITDEKKSLIADHPPAPEKPITFDNLWDKIPYLYKMQALENPVLSNQRIESEKTWYLNHPEYLYRVSERAQPYLYLIVEQIEQRQLPAELALLPIVESAFRPHAYSSGRAAGLWQFIPGTGKDFGLKQNWWYDGRRDIYAATNAALDYLEQLSKQFDNDWLLALAAYNAGAGTINKAIKYNQSHSKGVSYWDLELSKETEAYVPKLLALAQIIKQREENKIALLTIKNEAYLGLVDSENHIDLAVAAGLANISINDIYKYNPGFNQWATDPDGPHHLLLPIDAMDTFNKNLEITDKNQLIGWSKYQIKPGDSLHRIAKQYAISVNALKKANRLNSSRIRAGKMIIIPIAGKNAAYYSPQVNQQRDKIIAQINSKKRIIYRVKQGDSLWTISRKYRLPYKKLAKVNGISTLSTLSIGQRLKVWLAPDQNKSISSAKYLASADPSNKTKIKYHVRNGDSLYDIAKRYNVSIKQVVNWNQLSQSSYLQPGQKLVLYVKS